MKKAVLVILGLLVLVACARTPKYIPPYALLIEPAIQIYKDPILGVTNPYKTFSIFSKSILTDRTQMGGGILEKQMLFALRNRFEQLGYKFVNLDQFPDFLATVDGSAEFKEVHVPPKTAMVPNWTPGRTITSYTSYGWGTYGTSTTTTHIPGYMTWQRYTKPGYKTGAFLPSITVTIFDGKSFQRVWYGIGVGSSQNPDLRVCGQLVLTQITQKFPKRQYFEDDYPRSGIRLHIFTFEGNDYFPVITEIKRELSQNKDSLQVHDVILAINGIPTKNKSYSEITVLLHSVAGGNIPMTVWRVDKQLDLEMVFIP